MKALIFGTVYTDTLEKLDLMENWVKLHRALNPHCDLLLVDSASPLGFTHALGVEWLRFEDNIGHLARGGRDGWGRAFCAGLQYAIDHGYDYAGHVEADSLFRLPVQPIFHQMREEGAHVASVPVRGTRRIEIDWVETGLMMFNVDYVRRHDVVKRYDWQNCEEKRKYPHLPEWFMHRIVRDHLRVMPWSAERGDQGQIRIDNVGNYDWITHVEPKVYKEFVRSVLD